MGPDHFLFYKTKPLIDQYARFMSLEPNFSARNILELGVFDGGSAAFWFEIFRPSKLVGVDITKGKDSEYFQRYVAANDLNENIKIYWGTDQSDAKRLRDIANSDFSGSLDLVFDDASHAYEPTKSSFETLFPFCDPAGYILSRIGPGGTGKISMARPVPSLKQQSRRSSYSNWWRRRAAPSVRQPEIPRFCYRV